MIRFTRPASDPRTAKAGVGSSFLPFGAVVAGFLSINPVAAVEPGRIVDAMPVETLDGHRFVMKNFEQRRATVVALLSARCDETRARIGAIEKLHETFRFRRVLFVGLCPHENETGPELRRFLQRSGVRFPVYRDVDGQGVRSLGATVTPEFFLIDRERKLVYRGNLAGLTDAIKQMLSGAPIDKPRTRPDAAPIGKTSEPREVPDPYGSFAFSSELIFEKIAGVAAHHCSTLTETPAGDLLCMWYGGSYESADDQVLFLARRRKGTRDWSTPRVVVRNHGQPPGNAVIFTDGQDRIWIVWGRMEADRPLRRGGGWGQCRLMYRISENDGRAWSDDRPLDERVKEDTFGWLVRNVPIRLDDQSLLLPVSGKVGKKSGSFFLTTADEAATWNRTGLIPVGSQPTVVQRSDGSLLTLLRGAPRIRMSISTDRGKTWTPPAPTPLKNPGAGIAVTRLQNGHLVLAFNDSQARRTPLSVVRSVDEGKSWQQPRILEANPGEYSYPCVIQTSDGKIHVTYTYRRYTIKHVVFDEPWLIHTERPN